MRRDNKHGDKPNVFPTSTVPKVGRGKGRSNKRVFSKSMSVSGGYVQANYPSAAAWVRSKWHTTHGSTDRWNKTSLVKWAKPFKG